MSLTARHKKAGGFRKLVNSLETTPPERREKILEAMRKEDPDFIAEVERCLFDFDEFLKINDMIICEIVGALKSEMRMLSMALFHSKPELIEKFTKNMQLAEALAFREQNELLTSVMTREQLSGRFRVIVKARELEAARKFTLKKYSEHYHDDA